MSNFAQEDEWDDLEFETSDDNIQDSNDDFQEFDDDEPTSNDLIDKLLLDRGISDKNNIKFEDESGVITSKSWDSLTEEEQRNILSYETDYDPEKDLDDEEIQFLNYLRANNISPSEYVNNWNTNLQNANYIAQQAMNNQPEQTFTVDDFSDDELFVLDLQAKNQSITDEEALQMLENVKSNETIFEKQIEGLRNEYRQLEQNKIMQQQADREYQDQLEFEQFSNDIVNSINNLQNFGNLDVALDDNDKEELASFILDKDETGVSYLGKVLNDPESLVQMAWFALHGADTFNEIDRYMTETIRRSNQAAYQRGLQDGSNSRSRVAISKSNNNNKKSSELDDLDF